MDVLSRVLGPEGLVSGLRQCLIGETGDAANESGGGGGGNGGSGGTDGSVDETDGAARVARLNWPVVFDIASCVCETPTGTHLVMGLAQAWVFVAKTRLELVAALILARYSLSLAVIHRDMPEYASWLVSLLCGGSETALCYTSPQRTCVCAVLWGICCKCDWCLSA